MTTYPLTAEDRELQERTRRFVEEDLIPWETYAEEHDGAIPDGVHEAHRQKVIELGLYAMNLPKDLGGGGFTMLQLSLIHI